MPENIKRQKTGKSFKYTYKDNPVGADDLDRISSLVIPPAWTNVEITKNKAAKIQVRGKDSNGKTQYIYHVSFRAKQESQKFDRIMDFAGKLPKLRRRVTKDLNRKRFDKRKVIACAISMMDETYFRVGNEQYAQENNSYGLTTLRSKHVTVNGSRVIFDFIGKSGQQQHKEIHDDKIARLVKKLDDMPGYELFRYYDENNQLQNLSSGDINDYIKETIGTEYTAKDFRTWGGTLLACMELSKIARPETKTERKKVLTSSIKRVAKKLGNTPAVTRGSYIDPRVISMFNESNKISEVYAKVKEIKRSRYFNQDEKCAVKILAG